MLLPNQARPVPRSPTKDVKPVLAVQAAALSACLLNCGALGSVDPIAAEICRQSC